MEALVGVAEDVTGFWQQNIRVQYDKVTSGADAIFQQHPTACNQQL